MIPRGVICQWLKTVIMEAKLVDAAWNMALAKVMAVLGKLICYSGRRGDDDNKPFFLAKLVVVVNVQLLVCVCVVKCRWRWL